MQLEKTLPEQTDATRATAIHPRPKALPPASFRCLGQKVTLAVTADPHLRDDSLWRAQAIYEPALASQTLAQSGVALDIGAGYGAFAIPFALANPGWTLWAFEPEPEAFAALTQNVKTQGLTNVLAVNAAVTGPIEGFPTVRASTALSGLAAQVAGADAARDAALAKLMALLPPRAFRRHVDMRNVIEASPATGPDFEAASFPSLPAQALLALQPNLLKLLAPHAEVAILEALTEAPLHHILGESWTHVPASLVHGATQGQRQTWLPRAGDPLLRLRRGADLCGHRPGLDIVVALYNNRAFVTDCVDSLLADADPDIRILVVDDGSTDGSGDLVASRYAGNDRVVLLTKENGGCASARNFGRMHSDASHIAFVDADDLAGPGLFSGLLDLARHTGAEVVQGGFETFEMPAEGKPLTRRPSYESEHPEIIHAFRHDMGAQSCHLVPSWLLIQGQPSIWRRVYRRDFLDNRAIWFPEHIRAFDDQIFQLLTLQHVANVPMLDGVHYLYRQHPGQDIRQGDERHFYSLEMFRMALKRGMTEGWGDFRPMLASFVNTVNWSWAKLRPDLRPAFEQGAAELWVAARQVVDASAFDGLGDERFSPPDFGFYCRLQLDRISHLPPTYGHAYLDSIRMHPSAVRYLARLRQPT